MKKPDEYLIHLIILVIFAGALILLDHIFGKSLETFLYAVLPAVLLLLLYTLINRRAATLESTVKGLLEAHIPNIVFIQGLDAIMEEFTRAVNEADRYVMTTGGRAKMQEYLKAIEDRIAKKDVEYYRILFGKKISKELKEHLLGLVGKQGVYFSHTETELSPTLLVTEKVAFIGLPEPQHGSFQTCLKIPEEKVIEKMGRYIRNWYASTDRVSTTTDIERIEVD